MVYNFIGGTDLVSLIWSVMLIRGADLVPLIWSVVLLLVQILLIWSVILERVQNGNEGYRMCSKYIDKFDCMIWIQNNPIAFEFTKLGGSN